MYIQENQNYKQHEIFRKTPSFGFEMGDQKQNANSQQSNDKLETIRIFSELECALLEIGFFVCMQIFERKKIRIMWMSRASDSSCEF